MTRKILILAFCFMLPSGLFAGESKILALTGKVEVLLTAEDEDWIPAARDMEIKEGGAIRTGADGAVIVLMPNKTKIWLRRKSNLEIEQRKSFASRLSLLFGRIKVRVPHLMRREKFMIKTPTAVCAVRGTEFTLATTEEGKMRIAVLYGEVKLDYITPPNKGKSVFYIPQGHVLSVPEKGKQGKQTLLTKRQENSALENWDPGLTKKERQKTLRQKKNDRRQIKEFARVANNTNRKIRNFTNNVKESDIEAGRTLKDVHGNIVRVDQRLMRPDNKTLQFFNLVKRPVYVNRDSTKIGGFKYNGASSVSNRLDLLQMNIVFNRDLPAKLEEWPGFFDSSSVHADKAAFISANRTDASNIFFMAEYYLRDAARDELVNNSAVVGFTPAGDGDRDVLITGIANKDDFALIANVTGANAGFNIIDNGADTGRLKEVGGGTLTSPDIKWAIKMPVGKSWEQSSPGDVSLYHFQADRYHIGGVFSNGESNPGNDKFWYAKENYVIGNGGGIANVDNFTSSGKDPFSILKEHAFETVMYIKADDDGSLDKVNDHFNVAGTNYGNIDIVVIPDLAVAAVQRMLPILTKLSE